MRVQTAFASPAVSTAYLSADSAARLVSRTGVIECLRAMVSAIEADFLRWDAFDKSSRLATHSDVGVIELMPVSDATDYAFKYVNGHPANTRLGLPTVMAFGALADVRTGMPLFLSELTLTTALRTAATSAMVARRLARTDSQVMALIGNGSQSEFQALAFADLVGIRQLRLFDIDRAACDKLVRNLQPYVQQLGLAIEICASTRDAVRGADIVTTATADKMQAAILTADMIEPGMHINGVGGDCPGKTELAPGVLEMARVFVEYEPQTRREGDLQQMPADFDVTEFWRVLSHRAEGRTSPHNVTVFDSVGFALEDYAALRTLRALGEHHGLLEQLALIPRLDNPKDLFSVIAAMDSQTRPAAASGLMT